MHWIKHLTAFSRKAFMVEIGHSLGNGACYAVWLLLERIGEPWDGKTPPELCLPHKEWRNVTQLSEKKFQKLLEILQENAVIFNSKEQQKVTLRADILLNLQDEATSKRQRLSGIKPEELRKPSGLDTDKEPEADKRQNTVRPISAGDRHSIIAVLRRKGIAPESPLGESWVSYLEEHSPRNPAGYLTHILTQNPDFDPRRRNQAHEAPRREQCLHIGDVLQQMQFSKQQSGP